MLHVNDNGLIPDVWGCHNNGDGIRTGVVNRMISQSHKNSATQWKYRSGCQQVLFFPDVVMRHTLDEALKIVTVRYPWFSHNQATDAVLHSTLMSAETIVNIFTDFIERWFRMCGFEDLIEKA